jgi:hypothetical protein
VKFVKLVLKRNGNFTTTWIVTVETKDTHVRIVEKHFGIRITYIGTGYYTRRLRQNIDVMFVIRGFRK